ncbi:DUF4012 domain-containing protein [Aeromicrobium fastidiosum]|uniref:DUF4012 domain-containing protein n=1 Tax=Aeromicrobium fastidiosum TaxID=52699 RepID=A0A641ASH2_9ACTN|nr:DUF4012 domain-containing protein [Aeromicrobium fastidiosum]KAA1379838.1 DUF4012 domain-containing protein [Aeromicrobium fastidiosum]MBP2389334.1 hypothetical protein [Aeromicrobium fastidiosum]
MELLDRVRTRARRTRRRIRRWYRRQGTRRVVVMGVAAVLALGLLVFTYQALRTTSDLRRAAQQSTLLQEQVITGDAAARRTLDELRASTASAESRTDGVLWSIGSLLPVVGDNVEAVRTVSAALDLVAREALPPVVEVSARVDLDAFSPRDGTVDLANVEAIAPAVAAADAALTKARADLAGIDPTDLLAPLRRPVGTIKDQVVRAQEAAASSDVAARLMPTMLGGSGTRRYLLVIQNNAEVRATGGIVGSYAVITAKNGRLTMGEQGSNLDLKQFDDPVLPMTKDETSVFTDQLVRDLRDVNVTPDFPRSGEIARTMAKDGLGVDVDGVLSVDPVAMSYLLAGTGPVTLESGATLDQGTAVEQLLNRVYLTSTDLLAQDDFYESAARSIFDVVTSGDGQTRTVIGGLVRAADENRLMLWSRHPGEQAAIARTGVSGAFPRGDDRTPHVGVYFGDTTASKMEYYFDFTTLATSRRCLADGRQLITVTADVVSNAPRSLPRGVSSIDADVPLSQMRLLAWLYAPSGGRFTDIRLDGKPQVVTTASLDGRAETSVPFTLDPGQRRRLTATMVSGPGQEGDPVLSTTPGVQTIRNDVAVPSACR